MPDISVTHTPDAMKAYLYIADLAGGDYPTEDELQSVLRDHGVIFGVNADMVRSMVQQKALNMYIEVAQGVFPTTGTAGTIEILVDVSNKGKPKMLADGRVDHHDISYIISVIKGAPLLKHIPPVPGQPGRTVFNKPIDPPPVADKPFIAGKGAKIDPDNQHILIADIDGDVVIHSKGTIDVVDNKTINGNIDYSTGNIRFPGNLKIFGTVLAGFEVEAEGNCYIGGNVEDAKIMSHRDIEITGGAIGVSKAYLKCAGSLKVKHIANFNAQAGGDIRIIEDALHCTISAEGNITAKAIVGGCVSASKTIEAEAIGTEAEPKTIVDLGGRYVLMQKKDALLKELAALTGEIGSMKECIFFLVRDEMDAEGKLHGGSMARLATMKEEYRRRKEKYIQAHIDIETVDGKLKNNPSPVLKAHSVFPNTIVKFGTVETLIKEKLNHARITIDMEKIIIGKY